MRNRHLYWLFAIAFACFLPSTIDMIVAGGAGRQGLELGFGTGMAFTLFTSGLDRHIRHKRAARSPAATK